MNFLTRIDGHFQRRSQRAIILLSVLVLGWLTYVVVFIEREPDHGAPSPGVLRSRMLAALRADNADDLGLLFEEDSISDSYASDYLDQIAGLPPDNFDVRLQKSGDEQLLILRTTVSGGPSCTAWLVSSGGRRWFLEGGAVLLSAEECR
jgi:hypothetical protein